MLMMVVMMMLKVMVLPDNGRVDSFGGDDSDDHE